jgi:hypothetical protein
VTDNPHIWDQMTEQERAGRFRHFTLEQFRQWKDESGLPEYCDDDATLRAAAEIQVRAERAARPGAA